MNQALMERFYSQGNKKHVEYVIRVSGMGEQEAGFSGCSTAGRMI